MQPTTGVGVSDQTPGATTAAEVEATYGTQDLAGRTLVRQVVTGDPDQGAFGTIVELLTQIRDESRLTRALLAAAFELPDFMPNLDGITAESSDTHIPPN